ncbi:protein kinase domain-containing protein [Actinocorallia longicatena]|uniref:non-specific serine/threonine protein kinase n=1 Tax=Actinocorallia longicatena TaxID=111803 RepID=A0ABP6QDK2_9ACTN
MHEGLVLIDRYEVVRKLGQGGMGAVWEARDRLLGRRVAIKTLAVNPGADATRRFRGEAQIGASLQHPGITVVYDIGDYDGTLFLIMEYLEGHDLKQLMTAGPLPVPRAVELASELLKALGAAHAQGVVHRDIKPGNVMVTGAGQLKILDFGIARFTDSTMTGSVMGTPAYMAPEQFTGGYEVDGRCDLYSFGIVLYELLTGRQPFECSTMPEFVYAHLHRVPASPRSARPEIPAGLDRLVLDLLAKDPAERPGSAEAVVARLEGALNAPSVFEQPPQQRGEPSPYSAQSRAAVRTPPPFSRPETPQPFPPHETVRPAETRQPQTPPPFGQQAPQQQTYPAPTPAPYSVPYQQPPAYQQQGYAAPFPTAPVFQPPVYGYVPAGGVRLASWWRRAAGFVIDWLIGGFISILCLVAITWGDPPDAELTDAQGIGWVTVWSLVYLGIGLMEGAVGWGPGKGICMIRVVDARTGLPIGVLRGPARTALQLVNYASCYVGWLWPLWDRERQTFADKIVNTKIIVRS